MKKESEKKKNTLSVIKINFILLLVFMFLNNCDYFSTYLSIWDWGIEINPVIRFMFEFPLLFFVWKIILLPLVVWWFVYESRSKKVMWCLGFVDLVYLVAILGNLRVVF